MFFEFKSRRIPHPVTPKRVAEVPTTALEQYARWLEIDASHASGAPAYPSLERELRIVLLELEQRRPLRRWEYINAHGYQAWVERHRDAQVPEDHPVDPLWKEPCEQATSSAPCAT